MDYLWDIADSIGVLADREGDVLDAKPNRAKDRNVFLYGDSANLNHAQKPGSTATNFTIPFHTSPATGSINYGIYACDSTLPPRIENVRVSDYGGRCRWTSRGSELCYWRIPPPWA